MKHEKEMTMTVDRFVSCSDDDTSHLKRIALKITRIVEQAPDDNSLSLDEINDVVHEVRQHHAKRKGNK